MRLSIRDKRAKSEYVSKKTEESGNITYIYSDKHVEKRNKAKTKKIMSLSKSLDKLRTEVKKDIKSEDSKEKQMALVVALMDETYERVGNQASAKEDHHGVTTWKVKHVTFSGGKAKVKYTGKSGVSQEKEVSTKAFITALKEQMKDKKKGDEIFPDVTGTHINKYLKPFNITAKDIRGYHANMEMKKALQKAKKPKDPKDRKKEFTKALEETAKRVGHEPSTLKNQYLMPSIEKSFVESGKVAGP